MFFYEGNESKKAQGALEYLLIIGGAIVLVGIVATILISSSSNAQGTADGAFDAFGQIKNQGSDDLVSQPEVARFTLENGVEAIYLEGNNYRVKLIGFDVNMNVTGLTSNPIGTFGFVKYSDIASNCAVINQNCICSNLDGDYIYYGFDIQENLYVFNYLEDLEDICN